MGSRSGMGVDTIDGNGQSIFRAYPRIRQVEGNNLACFTINYIFRYHVNMSNVTFDLGHAGFHHEKSLISLRSRVLIDVETLDELSNQKVRLAGFALTATNIWITSHPLFEVSFDVLLRSPQSARLNDGDWESILHQLSSALTKARLWDQLDLTYVSHTHILKELANDKSQFIILLKLKVLRGCSSTTQSQPSQTPLRSNVENLQCPSCVPKAKLRKVRLCLEFEFPNHISMLAKSVPRPAHATIPRRADYPLGMAQHHFVPEGLPGRDEYLLVAGSAAQRVQPTKLMSASGVQRAVFGLADAALRTSICRTTPRLLAGIRAIGLSYQTTLQEASPVLFVPGYATALIQHHLAIPILARTLQRCLQLSQKSASAVIQKGGEFNISRSSAVNTDQTDSSSEDNIHHNLWVSMVYNVGKMHRVCNLKPLNRSDHKFQTGSIDSLEQGTDLFSFRDHQDLNITDRTEISRVNPGTRYDSTIDDESIDFELIRATSVRNTPIEESQMEADKEDRPTEVCILDDLYIERSENPREFDMEIKGIEDCLPDSYGDSDGSMILDDTEIVPATILEFPVIGGTKGMTPFDRRTGSWLLRQHICNDLDLLNSLSGQDVDCTTDKGVSEDSSQKNHMVASNQASAALSNVSDNGELLWHVRKTTSRNFSSAIDDLFEMKEIYKCGLDMQLSSKGQRTLTSPSNAYETLESQRSTHLEQCWPEECIFTNLPTSLSCTTHSQPCLPQHTNKSLTYPSNIDDFQPVRSVQQRLVKQDQRVQSYDDEMLV